MARKVDPHLKYLHTEEVNHKELLQILLENFGQTSQVDDRVLRCQRQEAGPYLDIHLNKRNEIESVVPSPKFPDELWTQIETKIRESLIDNQNPAVRQTVAFCLYSKVEGVFRYNNQFQIIPVPDYAPQPPQLAADHPFLLQFSYVSSRDGSIDDMRVWAKALEYVKLLNVFLKEQIKLPFFARHTWVMETDDPNNWHSRFKQVGYTYPRFDGKPAGFTEADGDLFIRRIASDVYYSTPLVRWQELHIPDNLEQSLDLAFSLSSTDWERFLRACIWLYQADTTWMDARSASFIALVTALECLIDKPPQCPDCNQTLTEGIEHCQRCGQPRYRLSRNFREFLEQNVPFLDEVPDAKKTLYDTRSELTHGLDLLRQDLEPWSFLDLKSQQQRRLYGNLHFIVVTAIYNWLRKRSGA